MTIHFYIKYHTAFGEALYITGDHTLLGGGDESQAIRMTYFNEEFWSVEITFPKDASAEDILYRYFVKDLSRLNVYDGEGGRYLSLDPAGESMSIIDTWNEPGEIGNVFFTEAMHKVLPVRKGVVQSSNSTAEYTHEFRVKAPLLHKDETVVLVGSTKNLGSWDTENPVILEKKNDWYTGRVHLEDNEWPATYKYGVYNFREKKLLFYEEGENRIVYKMDGDISVFHDDFVRYQPDLWRGAGISVPVFSIRSAKSFGVGEFSDLKRLVDWAKKTGFQLIQILPVNDTIAEKNWNDSYPYAAISAFALHPLYIHLDGVAGKEGEEIMKLYRKKQRKLNQLDYVDYEQVISLKTEVLKKLYQKKKTAFRRNADFNRFFEENKDWLQPYAAFCYLRDLHDTPDFSKWPNHEIYNQEAIEKLSAPNQKSAGTIWFYYFVQYHLHLQLKEAAEYAAASKVLLKGDIPIGIYRYSSDAWTDPDLYNMTEQAGAPPDDFAVKGQNWGFPTYNWDKMKEDHFGWWKRRFKQMSTYFDAFRIDHILGFFRIWSIPLHAVEGLLGRFVPALPVDISEFAQHQINFNHARYCLPYITGDIVDARFGDRSEEVKESYLEIIGEHQYRLKDKVDTQRKVAALLPEDDFMRQGLFDLISNVLLIEESGSQDHKFHFRIDMDKTTSFDHLDSDTQQKLKNLYIDYFYHRQDTLWRKEAMEKLPALKRSTNMLIFGEDLGMVPHSVPEVMKDLGILSLEIQRMPKVPGNEFFHPKDAPYLSVVTPATHDMSTIRGWWEEDAGVRQRFYNQQLGHYGEAPVECAPWINREIVVQHVYSPAMWCIFQVQDLFGINDKIRRKDPAEERINVPADPHHHWKYRMHISLDSLMKQTEFNSQVQQLIAESNRLPIK